MQGNFSQFSVFYSNLTKNTISKKFRINQEIKSKTIRLVGDEGEQKGIMGIDKALAMAKEQGLDLVEVAPQISPPVCKIMDYGKFQYHQKKVESKHRSMQKKSEQKGIRLGFKTELNDMQTKAKHARKFIEDTNNVNVTMMLKGREGMFSDLALEKMKKFYELLEDVADIETHPKKQGRSIFMILTPKK